MTKQTYGPAGKVKAKDTFGLKVKQLKNQFNIGSAAQIPTKKNLKKGILYKKGKSLAAKLKNVWKQFKD